ncbi:PREDICTED: abscisic acid receptor PYL5-like [Tarenaya hassleriana]|uniref:abscisic acid receptor PYL5-like n=1 Tax=Tarenaya hassleriana TaxID=28532 RepID=UPI00053C5D82|nr:PREDICTED: abscisic acid receptor PYL5-like [Tarenaya hassleriana]
MQSSVQLRRATSPATSSAAENGFHHSPETVVRRVCLTRGMHVPEHVAWHHTHEVGPDQCSSAVVQTVHAPLERVWAVVRRFDNPQAYKSFVRRCHVISGGDSLAVGNLREVHVVSGLPAGSSTERLEILDDDLHVISFSVVDGDHRLKNYRSVTTLHAAEDGGDTVVVESYVVDVPPGNTPEETLSFVDTIVRCNLQSLARSTAMNMQSR